MSDLLGRLSGERTQTLDDEIGLGAEPLGAGTGDRPRELADGPRQEVLEGGDLVERDVVSPQSAGSAEGLEEPARARAEGLREDGDDFVGRIGKLPPGQAKGPEGIPFR